MDAENKEVGKEVKEKQALTRESSPEPSLGIGTQSSDDVTQSAEDVSESRRPFPLPARATRSTDASLSSMEELADRETSSRVGKHFSKLRNVLGKQRGHRQPGKADSLRRTVVLRSQHEAAYTAQGAMLSPMGGSSSPAGCSSATTSTTSQEGTSIPNFRMLGQRKDEPPCPMADIEPTLYEEMEIRVLEFGPNGEVYILGRFREDQNPPLQVIPFQAPNPQGEQLDPEDGNQQVAAANQQSLARRLFPFRFSTLTTFQKLGILCVAITVIAIAIICAIVF